MFWTDLNSRDLFALSESGRLRLAGSRVVILDCEVVALLSRLAPDSPTADSRRNYSHDIGYVQGWRLASRLLTQVSASADLDAWRIAADCATWVGLGFSANERTPQLTMFLRWKCSPEGHSEPGDAGRDTGTSCHFLAGLLGGCASRALQRTVDCVETVCVAQGNTECLFNLVLESGLDEHWRLRLSALQRSAVTPPDAPCDSESASPAANLANGSRDSRMRELMSLANRVAPLNLTVLITGESGVGKEKLAEFIHQHSKRAKQPYLPINCAALPDTLLESELFGHRRGAFTGAHEEHRGLFEAVDGGTIFLDEIGEISPSVQAKLLRVLSDLTVRRVGDTRTKKVDVRIVAATNRDLWREVQEGRFRKDLFYRLNVVTFHVPPLRDRPEDLRLLLRAFLAESGRKLDRQTVVGYTPRALDALLSHSWPGNIRELGNVVERACAVAAAPHIDLADLPDNLRRPSPLPASQLNRPLRVVEREHILAVLNDVGGNRARAAEVLGLSRQTLFRRLRDYDAPSQTKRSYQN